jgi:hypothetical protein
MDTLRKTLVAVSIVTVISLPAHGQEVESLHESIRALQKQASEMASMMEEMKAEILRSRADITALRLELEKARPQLVPSPSGRGAPEGRSEGASPATVQDENLLEKLAEDQELLSAKVDEQYQTKVESASRYRVRLSGVVLLNMFSGKGAVDNLDFPNLVVDDTQAYRRASFGASMRQSQLGLELFGPQINGGRVSGDIQFDFAGGFPNVSDGVTSGLLRLRTAGMRLTWPKTTVAVGQDIPFISPLAPSSISSLATPAFSYSGNLWTWIPQARVERQVQLTEASKILLQGGILDPLTGERPPFTYSRTAQAGEASRQPAYAARTAWNSRVFERDLSVGIGGFYSRQDWDAQRRIDAWAGTADWILPASQYFEVSGEFYHGRAIGGLGGGLGRSVMFSGDLSNPATQVKGLGATGGWTQVKFRQTEKLEWNTAVGQDNVPARDLRLFPVDPHYFNNPTVARNRGSLFNFIYQARSNVLLSVEYRRLRTFLMRGDSRRADFVNFSMGVLF